MTLLEAEELDIKTATPEQRHEALMEMGKFMETFTPNKTKTLVIREPRSEEQ